ncbi:hypothetical protein [Bradyrhizobium sp. 45]|uniref:hypothetical protein n=1 Tax=Bradyrhizobium sp. 45 TaxID=1043587 RepID=UPI001FFA6024|nr:hypothetical protein [Bradyrhizobium sp. 45]MCK1306243.1 hypothetical protein [Bradyrhizobium sp. 45]
MSTPPNNVTTLNSASLSVIPRVENGHFAKGGPGRPPGSRNKLSAMMLADIKQMGPDAIIKLREHLSDKDSPSHWKALEIILRYCLPPARTVELDDAEPATIMQSFIDGTLSADEARALAIAIEKLKNVADMDDILRELQELTAITKQQSSK